jgi:hypothetical protein
MRKIVVALTMIFTLAQVASGQEEQSKKPVTIYRPAFQRNRVEMFLPPAIVERVLISADQNGITFSRPKDVMYEGDAP